MRHRTKQRWGGRGILLNGLLGLALIAIVAAPAEAQQGKQQRGMDPEARMERLKESLDLDDAQVAALEPIFAAHDQKRSELIESHRAARQAMREQMESLRSQMDEEIAAILTETQMTSYLEQRAAMRARFREGRSQGPGRRGDRGKRSGRGEPPPADG